MKKLLSILFVGALILTGCGSKDSKSSKKDSGDTKIGVIIYDYNDNFMSFVKSSLMKAFDEKDGVEVLMENAQNDQAKLNDIVDNMLAQGVDALAINLVDPSAAQAVLDKANAEDVPVVFFNKEPEEKVLTGKIPTYYVGTTSEEAGVLQGELISAEYTAGNIKDNNGDGKIGYVMLKGEPGHPDAEARTLESVKTATAMNVPLDKIQEEAAFWQTPKAKDACDAILSAKKDAVDLIIANNDGMAAGCIASMKELKIKLPIVGVDGLPDAIESISAGDLSGTVLNDPKNQAQATVDLVYNVAKGKKATEGTSWTLDKKNAVRVPYVIITKDSTDVAEEAYAK